MWQRKKSGNVLMGTILAAIVMIFVANAYFTTLGGSFQLLKSSRTAQQAQQFAEIEANTLKLKDYDEIDSLAHPRRSLTGVIDGADGWEDTITIGDEKMIGDNKQRIASIEIYQAGDTLARYRLQVPLSSQGSSDGLAIGCIVAWATDGTIPKNYLECNGQMIDSSKYPKLAALMSHTPDYRGMFLRGFGSQSYSQLNGSRNGITSTTYASGNVGDIQGDAIRNIVGYIHMGHLDFYMTGGVFSHDYGDVANYGVAKWAQTVTANFNAGYVVPVANENRPINKAVRYLIKAK